MLVAALVLVQLAGQPPAGESKPGNASKTPSPNVADPPKKAAAGTVPETKAASAPKDVSGAPAGSAPAGAPVAKGPLQYPMFLAAGPDNTVFVSDLEAHAIVQVTAEGAIKPVAAGTKQYRTILNRPRGLAVLADGGLVVADPSTMDLVTVKPGQPPKGWTGRPLKTKAGTTLVVGDILQPEAVAIVGGQVWYTDLRHRAVFRMDGNKPVKLADLPAPRGLVADPAGKGAIVVSDGGNSLVRLGADGKIEPIVKGRAFEFPMGVAVLKDGSFAVADGYSKAVWKVTADGKVAKFAEGGPLVHPTGVCVRTDGKLVVADPRAAKLFLMDPADGKVTALSPR
jgi:sugar lactone lactonase YvrE